MTGPPDPKDLWRDQPTETPPMTLEQIHARGFQDRIKRRNMVEYVASAVVVVAFSGYIVVLPHPILKLASALVIVGTFFMVWQLHRRGSARHTPADDALGFHRAELVRQLEAGRSAWRWYLAPFMPGLVLFMVGMAMARPDAPLAWKLSAPLLTLAFVLAWFWLNSRGKRRLEAQIAELDALRRD